MSWDLTLWVAYNFYAKLSLRRGGATTCPPNHPTTRSLRPPRQTRLVVTLRVAFGIRKPGGIVHIIAATLCPAWVGMPVYDNHGLLRMALDGGELLSKYSYRSRAHYVDCSCREMRTHRIGLPSSGLLRAGFVSIPSRMPSAHKSSSVSMSSTRRVLLFDVMVSVGHSCTWSILT